MQLIYRGVHYQSNPTPIAASAPALVGKYRGVNIQAGASKAASIPRSNLDLSYRGVHYHPA